MDRASTIRFYDHFGHASAAVCYQNTLHARMGDGRLDHARTHEPRDGKGVKVRYGRCVAPPEKHSQRQRLAFSKNKELAVAKARAIADVFHTRVGEI